MSDLKHQTVQELEASRITAQSLIQYHQRKIAELQSKINGQLTRLEWIDKYHFEKTPQEMTIAEVERALGHKLIIK